MDGGGLVQWRFLTREPPAQDLLHTLQTVQSVYPPLTKCKKRKVSLQISTLYKGGSSVKESGCVGVGVNKSITKGLDVGCVIAVAFYYMTLARESGLSIFKQQETTLLASTV